MLKTTKLNSRWTAFTLLAGGCAIVASAGAGIAQDVHVAPQAKAYHAHVIPVHIKLPHNHTKVKKPAWHLSNVYKFHLFGA